MLCTKRRTCRCSDILNREIGAFNLHLRFQSDHLSGRLLKFSQCLSQLLETLQAFAHLALIKPTGGKKPVLHDQLQVAFHYQVIVQVSTNQTQFL